MSLGLEGNCQWSSSATGFGPILSNIFINDFGTKVNVLTKFADDLKLGDSVNTEEDWIN